jgi:hypothetical protein
MACGDDTGGGQAGGLLQINRLSGEGSERGHGDSGSGCKIFDAFHRKLQSVYLGWKPFASDVLNNKASTRI